MMPNIVFEFNRTKAIEAIIYLANRISESEVYGICKLLYFADKSSLKKYGRFIFGESYVAMEEGTTPSNAYNLLRNLVIPDIKVEGNQVIALRDANLDYFSKADIECLDRIIEKDNDSPSKYYRWAEAHDEAYKEAWDRRGKKGSVKIPIENIAKTLENSEELEDYLLNSG